MDLKAYEELSFLRGFQVKCFISRLNTSSNESLAIWHKSHIVYQKTFIVKAAVDEALFELTWVDFQDEKDKQELLYFVEWKSSEVSTAIDNDCFQVKANARLKDQIKRLENNSHFGAFSIRMMAEQILSELLQQTLRYANISDTVEPEIDSLHQKFKQLLSKFEIDFNELGRMMQSTNSIEQLQAGSEVRKIMQKMNKVGWTLDAIRLVDIADEIAVNKSETSQTIWNSRRSGAALPTFNVENLGDYEEQLSDLELWDIKEKLEKLKTSTQEKISKFMVAKSILHCRNHTRWFVRTCRCW